MMFAAAVVSELAPEELQRRSLARYVFLWGDAFLEWARRWRKQLSRSGSRRLVSAAGRTKGELHEFERVLTASDGVRDYLVAKRQPLAAMRADDMDDTVAMWTRITFPSMRRLLDLAVDIQDELSGAEGAFRPVLSDVGLPFAVQDRVKTAFAIRDPYWYAAADTSAGLRSYTLPVAQGGELGRMIAQVNDVALHLDVLITIAPILWGRFPYDWFVRSSIVLEVAGLLDLTVGSPPTSKPHGRPTLLDLCHYGRAKEVAEDLARMRDSIDFRTRTHLRWCRDKFCAHMDLRLPVTTLHKHLDLLDAHGNIWLAQHLLTWLDALACGHYEVQLLLFGERRIGGWPLSSTAGGAAGMPDVESMPTSLSNLFRSIDSPFMIGTGTNLGSAVVAGLLAGRVPRPRGRAALPARESHYLAPPLHDRLQASS